MANNNSNKPHSLIILTLYYLQVVSKPERQWFLFNEMFEAQEDAKEYFETRLPLRAWGKRDEILGTNRGFKETGFERIKVPRDHPGMSFRAMMRANSALQNLYYHYPIIEEVEKGRRHFNARVEFQVSRPGNRMIMVRKSKSLGIGKKVLNEYSLPLNLIWEINSLLKDKDYYPGYYPNPVGINKVQ